MERSTAPGRLLSASSYRRCINLFLLYVGLATLAYGLATAHSYRSWTIAEWLINYQGGFVRRGLPGQIALALGHLLHLSPVSFVVLLYLGAYATLLLSGRWLLLRTEPRWWCLALLFSPATFSFQLLDVTGGFRKEILFLAGLGLLLWWMERNEPPAWLVSITLVAMVAFTVLSHEPLVCYSPYLFAALLVQGRDLRHSIAIFAPALLVGILLAAVSAIHHGDLNTARAICQSLGYTLQPQGKQVCSGGAIAYLARSSAAARAQTAARIWGDLYLLVYPVTGALALFPLVRGSIQLAGSGLRQQVRALWAVSLVAWLASIVLFIYAEDWGRWIYIHVVSLSLLLLFLEGRRSAQSSPPCPPAPAPEAPIHNRRSLLGLGAYATLWSLPHVPALALPFGYLGLVHYVLPRLGL